jgi:hypothetical protein
MNGYDREPEGFCKIFWLLLFLANFLFPQETKTNLGLRYIPLPSKYIFHLHMNF